MEGIPVKQSKTFSSGFSVEETIESLRQQLAAAHAARVSAQASGVKLLESLAASQAREQQANDCRIALVHQIHELSDHIERAEYCINDIDMLKQMRGQRAYAMGIASKWNQNGNPFANDASALEAMIAKAGEVAKGRAIAAASAINPIYGAGAAIDAIRALPGVTLGDLK